MMKPFVIPEITDEDVNWSARVLGLPANSFRGLDGKDPRQEVLRSSESIDVVACPGSGKTTLLVAKLAILAHKWPDQTRGMCVLSHTNVAQNEIQVRLGHSSVSNRLLSYPHYIGTIHGFVNDFLALPWLRSQGKRITRIDTVFCQEKRWARLKKSTRNALETNNHGSETLCIKGSDCDLGNVRWGKKAVLGRETATYQDMQRVCRESIEEGIYCYEEMFIWAWDLITRIPQCINAVRDRFPILLIDEAQDNSEEQSSLLERLFQVGPNPSIRQRFGDSNQAIFDSIKGSAASTDRFPLEARVQNIPDSNRFGQRIADLVSPLGLNSVSLKGNGPSEGVAGNVDGRHTLFIFSSGSEKNVLTEYAHLLTEVFSDEELRTGSFVAAGQVHRPPMGEDPQKIPQFVGHYWPDYSHELTAREPKPILLIGHLLLGIAKANATGECHLGIDAVASGIVRLALLINSASQLRSSQRPHHQIMRGLAENISARTLYTFLLHRFIVRRMTPTKTMWNVAWRIAFQKIAQALAGSALATADATSFTEWEEFPLATTSTKTMAKGENVFSFPSTNSKVRIRVGSLHSVKGETHTSILVLETFWHKHNLESLLPWLNGSRTGAGGAGERDQARLKLHYVGLTRPTRLLCIAMRQASFHTDEGNIDVKQVERMKDRGWNVKVI